MSTEVPQTPAHDSIRAGLTLSETVPANGGHGTALQFAFA
jgi:hypothetical protein